MTRRLQLDEKGRLLLPEDIREALRLRPLDSVELESEQGQIRLRPVHVDVGLTSKHGIPVFRTLEAISAELVQRTLDEVRHRSLWPDSFGWFRFRTRP
ncbi:MAG: hypothetical protein GC160_12905 [Acidobacteria bacterium]|nr:hypothetical protein [Acidobacteriota bacterium]